MSWKSALSSAIEGDLGFLGNRRRGRPSRRRKLECGRPDPPSHPAHRQQSGGGIRVRSLHPPRLLEDRGLRIRIAPAAADCEIDREVRGERDHCEQNLMIASEIGRIDHGCDVPIDEAAGITDGSARAPQLVLEGCQGTAPAEERDEDTPGCRRNMKPRHPSPTKREQTAAQHEDDECQVYEDDEVGKHTVEHGVAAVRRRAASANGSGSRSSAIGRREENVRTWYPVVRPSWVTRNLSFHRRGAAWS